VAGIPDKKAFPPRLLIIFLGTFLATSLGIVFVLALASWNAIDSQDAGKQFAIAVWSDVTSTAPWSTRNGAAPQDGKERFWSKLRRGGGSKGEK
jgi:hypothetical protein